MANAAPQRLREAKRQARSFERVRQAHQREVAEDYVELIADLIDVTGEARAVDLAERLGVPVVTSSLLQVPMVQAGLAPGAVLEEGTQGGGGVRVEVEQAGVGDLDGRGSQQQKRCVGQDARAGTQQESLKTAVERAGKGERGGCLA